MIRETIKRLLKNKGFFAFISIMPLVVVIIAIFIYGGSGDSQTNVKSRVGFIVEDKGELSKSLYTADEIIEDREEAEKLIKKGDLSAVFVIPENFSETVDRGEMPKITSIQNNDKMNISGSKLEGEIKSLVLNNFLKKEGITLNTAMHNDAKFNQNGKDIDFAYFMFNFMLIYFLVLTSGVIAEDMYKMKESGILKRNLLSPHSEISITLSIVMTYFILQFIFYMLYTSIVFIFFKRGIDDYLILITSIALSVLLSLSMSIFFARISKVQNVASMLASMLTMVMFFTTMFKYTLPDSTIGKLAMFSPLTYIMDMISKGELFPNALISLLISGVLLTLGSLRVKDYANS